MTISRALPFSIALLITAPLLAADAKEEMKPYTVTLREAAGKDKKIAFDMVPIPAGVFKMGSPATEKDRKKDEGPQVEVEVEAFWMGKHEVTWDEYDQFLTLWKPLFLGKFETLKKDEVLKDKLADAVSVPSQEWEQEARPIHNSMGRAGGYPAANMTQFAAKQYAKWLSKKTGHFYRLPTEAEWEYAARAGSTTAYPSGDKPDELAKCAWFEGNSDHEDPKKGYPRNEFLYSPGLGYRPVGKLAPNAWGLYDMHGNVSEWCIDQYVPDQYARFAGKRVKAADTIAWPTKMYPRVFRGGNWCFPAGDCRSAWRGSSSKDLSLKDPNLPKSLWWHTDSWHIGFRLVRPAKEPSDKEKLKYWDADCEEVQDVFKHYTADGRHMLLIVPQEKK